MTRLYGPKTFRTFAALFALAGALSSAQAKVIFALTDDNWILSIDSAAPGTLLFGAPVVGGLQPGESLSAIDIRPATGDMMGVGTSKILYDVFATNGTGLPIAVASPVADSFDGTLTGDKVGMDFNPTVDRIRLTTNMGSNLRLNPVTGNLSAQDTALSPPTGIVETAYDRSYPGASETTLFGLDAVNNSLVRIGGINGTPSPNGGAVTQIGPLGVDFGNNSALDFSGTDLLAILNIDGISTLVSLDPQTGGIVHNHGAVATNPTVVGMAVAPGFLNAVKLNIKRIFNQSQKDSIKFSTLIDIPAGYQVNGAAVHLNIGGVLRSYVLDDKGKATLGQDKVSLKVKAKKGVVEAQQAKFTVKMGGGNYVELEDEGLINTDIKNGTTHVFISIAYGTEIAQGNVPLTYTAKAGKSGKAKN